MACSDGGAGGARHTLAPKKKGGERRRPRPTPAHVRTHTWCKVQMLESAQRTHSAYVDTRTYACTYVRVAGGAVRTSVSRGRTAPTITRARSH